MKRMSLKKKFLVLFGCVAVAFLACNVLWSSRIQSDHMVDELLAQARGFSQEMDAVWEYITINQDRINYTNSGEFEFKYMYCSVAGKAVAALFARDSEYTIRYVSEEPRNPQDIPDEFELRALQAFAANPRLSEFYEVTTYDGESAFRYCSAMFADSGCLECHGSPAGEIDVTGYPKEGWSVGSLAGATSIVIPLEGFEARRVENVMADVTFYTLLLLCFLVLLFFGLRRLVTSPLQAIQDSIDKVGEGDFESRVDCEPGSKEMADLVDSFARMSDDLKVMYDSLEDQVVMRTEELARANEELASENEFKSNLIGMLGHELRTPLASTISLIEAEQKSPSNSDTVAETLDRVHQSSLSLLKMVNSTLELLRIETGGYVVNMEAVDACDFAGEVASEISFLAAEKGIDFRLSVGSNVGLVYSDPDKMRIVLTNLLSNAVRYTPSGGHVLLSVSFDEQSDAVSFSVSDTGMGISPEDLDRIFDQFYQAERASRMRLGNGLGLAIAREFSNAIGASITVSSALGEGSTFVFTVPVGYEWGDDDYAEDHVG